MTKVLKQAKHDLAFTLCTKLRGKAIRVMPNKVLSFRSENGLIDHVVPYLDKNGHIQFAEGKVPKGATVFTIAMLEEQQ